jgi:hypothetical protein
MGEATPPVWRRPSLEMLKRLTDRVLEVYPRPIRGYARLSAQMIAATVLLLAGLMIVAGLVYLIDSLSPMTFALVQH